jgi:hypothetical protein
MDHMRQLCSSKDVDASGKSSLTCVQLSNDVFVDLAQTFSLRSPESAEEVSQDERAEGSAVAYVSLSY